MHLPELNDSKKDFQLERFILFTDAVFAIAITLLVIEIKAPHIDNEYSIAQKIQQLAKLIPLFIGFAVSFFVIGIYWRAHHRIFGFVKTYDDKLITLNLMFLFTIACMPFSSAYDSENVGQTIAYFVYCLNIICTGLMSFLLLRYIANPKHKLSDDFINNPLLYPYLRARSLTVPLVFLISFVVDYFLHGLGRFLLILIWPLMAVIGKRYKRQHAKLVQAQA